MLRSRAPSRLQWELPARVPLEQLQDVGFSFPVRASVSDPGVSWLFLQCFRCFFPGCKCLVESFGSALHKGLEWQEKGEWLQTDRGGLDWILRKT